MASSSGNRPVACFRQEAFEGGLGHKLKRKSPQRPENGSAPDGGMEVDVDGSDDSSKVGRKRRRRRKMLEKEKVVIKETSLLLSAPSVEGKCEVGGGGGDPGTNFCTNGGMHI